MKPLVCNYFLTSECNDSCEFCSCWADKEFQAKKDSNTETVKKNLRIVKKAGAYVLNVTGGEPVLRGDIAEILRYAKRLGFFITFTTNGIAFAEKAASVTPFVDHLLFSLDAPTKQEHDRIRGTDSYDAVMEGIIIAKRSGVLPLINFTMTRETITSLPEMVTLAENLGVLLWINPVYNWHDVHGFESGSVEYVSRYIGRKNVAMNPAAMKFSSSGGNDTGHTVCKAGNASITILPDGTFVYPCVHFQKFSVHADKPEVLKRREVIIATSWHGRGEQCRGCMDWSYFNPSFLRSFNRYLVPTAFSLWNLFWKEIRLKTRLRPVDRAVEGRKEKKI